MPAILVKVSAMFAVLSVAILFVVLFCLIVLLCHAFFAGAIKHGLPRINPKSMLFFDMLANSR